MRKIVVKDDVAANAIEAEEDFAPEGLELVSDPDGNIHIGMIRENGVFVAPPPIALPVPEEISDRQFFEALATVGLIPRVEAIAAVSVGAVPTAMEVFFAGMDEDAEFKARMLLQGAIAFHRHHPLVEAFGATQGMTAEQIDDLWRMAASL